jgi:hypothetical protein
LNQTTVGARFAYVSPFESWRGKAWATGGNPVQMKFSPGLQFYPAELSPLFNHPTVANAPTEVRERLLVLSLYTYLEFTVKLEMGPVNAVAKLLTEQSFLPWLPPAMKNDGYLVYFDEGGHAEESKTLMLAVQAETGIAPLNLRPAFLAKLSELIDAEEFEFQPLVALFFVIVSETLITGSLSYIPHDENVQLPVREVTKRHAQDESRHHSYFKSIFRFVWPRLPAPIRRRVGMLLPEMIWVFLAPDRDAMEAMLEGAQIGAPPSRIVQQIVSSDRTAENIKKAAAPTLAMLNADGVMDDPEVREAFARRKLV